MLEPATSNQSFPRADVGAVLHARPIQQPLLRDPERAVAQSTQQHNHDLYLVAILAGQILQHHIKSVLHDPIEARVAAVVLALMPENRRFLETIDHISAPFPA